MADSNIFPLKVRQKQLSLIDYSIAFSCAIVMLPFLLVSVGIYGISTVISQLKRYTGG